MDQHPGNVIVAFAARALNEGKQVSLVIKGLSEPLTIDSIVEGGPFAHFTSGDEKWIARLDGLIGFREGAALARYDMTKLL